MTSVPWSNWPLPVGWEMKYEQSQRRYFFINHSTKTTSWDDPRKAVWEQQQQQQLQNQWQHASPQVTSTGVGRMEHIPLADMSRREYSTSMTAGTQPIARSPSPMRPAPVAAATKPLVTQQKYTPAPAGQSPRPSAAAKASTSASSHASSSSAGHPPAAALDEPVELSKADKDRLRMRLRGEFSKFDADIFEMALEATNFDENRSRALLKTLSEDQSSRSGPSHATAAPTSVTVAPPLPTTTTSHLDVTTATNSHLDVTTATGAANTGSTSPSQRRSPSPSSRPTEVASSTAVDAGSKSHVAGGQRSSSPSVTHSSGHTQSVTPVTPAAPPVTSVTPAAPPVTSVTPAAPPVKSVTPVVPPVTMSPFHHKTVAVAANPSLTHGHDKSLLIKDYVLVCGPNPEHRHGPNLDLRHGPTGALGPNQSLRHGPHTG